MYLKPEKKERYITLSPIAYMRDRKISYIIHRFIIASYRLDFKSLKILMSSNELLLF